MITKAYREQVQLLLEILPVLFETNLFALKDGTAINLFYRNMPRYSVDIDLCYLSLESRDETILKTHKDLTRIKHKLDNWGLNVHSSHKLSKNVGSKLTISNNTVYIKVEPSYILRGYIYKPQNIALCDQAQKEFKLTYNIPCLNIADTYGGKLCAALDRQHPRDLFDVMVLLKNEGITEEIKNSFIYHLLSSNRPIHELLEPNKLSLAEVYKKEFADMTALDTSLKDLESTRETLFSTIKDYLSDSDKQFLFSFIENQPQWNLFAFPKIKDYPSIQWKLHNQSKISTKKFNDYVNQVQKTLDL